MSAVPIVYLPGGGGRSSFWRGVADRLAYVGAPIVLGYPGFGDVPSDPALRSLSDLYEALVRVLPAPCDLVAQSMGGVLALRMAIEQPQRVRRLVLSATSGGVDVLGLGGAPWRDELAREQAEQGGAPRWFVDDHSDFTDRLGAIRAPTLLLFGGADPLAPPRVGEFLRHRLPDAKLIVLPGAGHSFALEDPEATARPIREHLTRG
ncbi:MAG TPA: alpha/beta fold hydrolase [Polyangiaceae bacterium]|nr:alpha/beta fold hydrolase [Polyangiaceae bacterium]